MHTDRTNRLALTVFCLIVFLAGVFGLTASTGGFGTAYAHRALLANRFGTYIGTHGDWLWPAAAAACLLIALIARGQRFEELHTLGKRILDAVFHSGLRAVGNVEELIT